MADDFTFFLRSVICIYKKKKLAFIDNVWAYFLMVLLFKMILIGAAGAFDVLILKKQ